MKVIILGGFLGSGKTTFLLQFAPFLATYSNKDPSVVILENEISMTDVDTKLLKSRNLTVRNIAAGCICCTSSASLPISVEMIWKEYDPEYLIIEATGMAYPDTIAQTIEEENHLPVTVAILADASRWQRLNRAMPDFVQGQLKRADAVFLNKTDMVEQGIVDQIYANLAQTVKAPIFPIRAKESIDPNTLNYLIGRHPQ